MLMNEVTEEDGIRVVHGLDLVHTATDYLTGRIALTKGLRTTFPRPVHHCMHPPASGMTSI